MLELDHLDASQEKTIEFWLYLDALPATDATLVYQPGAHHNTFHLLLTKAGALALS